MNKKRTLAITLRKTGKSYKEIERICEVARSTLSGWFRAEPWSKHIKRKLEEENRIRSRRRMQKVGRARAAQWRARRSIARDDAHKSFDPWKNDPLFVAGLMLYWGEGDNKVENGKVRLTNTHPAMLALFIRFLIKYCGVEKDKLRLHLLLYPDLSDSACKRYWSRHTGLPVSNFIQSHYIAGKHPTKRLEHGIGIVYIYSCEIKEMLLEWIQLSQTHLLK